MRFPYGWRLWFDSHGWWLMGGPCAGASAAEFVSGHPVTGMVLAGCFVFCWWVWGWLQGEPQEPDVGYEQWLPDERLEKVEPPRRHRDGSFSAHPSNERRDADEPTR